MVKEGLVGALPIKCMHVTRLMPVGVASDSESGMSCLNKYLLSAFSNVMVVEVGIVLNYFPNLLNIVLQLDLVSARMYTSD